MQAMVETKAKKNGRKTNKDWALFTLYFIMFLVVAGFGIILPILPFYAKDLGATGFQLGLMTTIFSLTQTAAAPFWGQLSDRVGRKPVLFAGLVGYALSYILMIWVQSVAMLLVVRALSGLLSASAFPAAQAYLVDLTTHENRGYAMGYMAAASNLGFLFGPSLGGSFAILGLRAAFFIAGVVILVTAGISLALLPTINIPPKSSLSLQGSMNPMSFLFSGADSALLWITMLVSFGTSTMYSILGYYMIDRFDALTSQTAVVYTLMGGVSALMQVFLVGRLLKILGEDFVILGSLLIGIVGFVGLVLAPELVILYIWVVVISISMALVRPAILVALSNRTHLEQGLTMGLQGSYDSFGRVIGPLWAGYAFEITLSGPYWSSAAIFGLTTGLYFILYLSWKRATPLPEGLPPNEQGD
jgi:DHA1 family multidrug resistance protein-like MFS transporter